MYSVTQIETKNTYNITYNETTFASCMIKDFMLDTQNHLIHKKNNTQYHQKITTIIYFVKFIVSYPIHVMKSIYRTKVDGDILMVFGNGSKWIMIAIHKFIIDTMVNHWFHPVYIGFSLSRLISMVNQYTNFRPELFV